MPDDERPTWPAGLAASAAVAYSAAPASVQRAVHMQVRLEEAELRLQALCPPELFGDAMDEVERRATVLTDWHQRSRWSTEHPRLRALATVTDDMALGWLR